MVVLRRRLACCTWIRDISNSIDFDQSPNGIMTYNGLENCILNANSCEDESVASRGDECPTDSLDEDDSSCTSSSNNASGSFSSQWTVTKRDEHQQDEWDCSESVTKENPSLKPEISDVEIMKEKFAKLLLGDDTTGGRKGHSSALALSNSITKLAGAVFGELWKLEPLSEERKSKWRKEMEWLLAPTNYMVELVPAKQYGANGRTLEIMRPKARGDIHMNLPALRKLDSMLLETLDAMKNTEFWYEEGGIQAEGRSSKWWLPMPQVPVDGLSDGERKKLLNQAKLVHQIFKAAKSINETILIEMPIPKIIGDALPKSGKTSVGDDLYKTLNTISSSSIGMLNSLNLKSEQGALETINRLETAVYAWKERILEQTSAKSPSRTSWSLKDPSMELDKIEFLINRAEGLLQQLRIRYPNLPQTFLDVMKIQYGKDIGHAILEAYSRVLGNLAFNILTRIGDIAQQDVLIDPNSPMAKYTLPGVKNVVGISGISVSNISSRHTSIEKVNNIQGKFSLLKVEKASYASLFSDESNTNSVAATPIPSPRCCMGKEACFTPPKMSP
ncbi:hypothetical protein L2E82_06788 [Cichorium intybus]|uniref:Uncharacterized protein n=1 Tax=Cichorium intybus TaxID=13427 RepID=A0ACB9HCA7_CICIN|nr:hypothetical protein L2E82_06788 [Cichorium intybus]